jgi:hypothetical protein
LLLSGEKGIKCKKIGFDGIHHLNICLNFAIISWPEKKEKKKSSQIMNTTNFDQFKVCGGIATIVVRVY